MFDARMRVDSIRLFVAMNTVSRHALISLKMANEEDVLVDLSENVIEDKSTPKRKRTRRWTDEETDILIDMFEESACLWDIFSKDYRMKDKRDKAYEKIQEELDMPIAEIKNKIIGLRSQLSREVAKTNQNDKTCFKMFYAVWPLCKTSACFNLKHV